MTPNTRTRWGLNFNSGPAILPKQVLDEAAQALTNFNNTGLSILEIGHRTTLFQEVMDEARQLVRQLMNLSDAYEVLFLQGGATTQFFQVPMNLLAADATAAYIDAGIWGAKAITEARLFGKVHIASSSKAQGYTCINKVYNIPAHATYLHITSNNTIEGTQQHSWPDTTVPLVADMSSDIFSRSLDFEKFDLIYAGAQKNIGAAGVTLVVVKKSILGKTNRQIPAMLDYQNHIAQGSMLNTPPVFAIYVCMLTLRWLMQQGGIPAIEVQNKAKADLLYQTLDSIPLYKPTVAVEDRSLMNVVWVLNDKELEKPLLEFAEKEGITGIQGHRTAGGFRASLYNAMPIQGVKTLVELLTTFAKQKG
jgi:phosphoserine aminotransferase